jgi:hypothetical protein
LNSLAHSSHTGPPLNRTGPWPQPKHRPRAPWAPATECPPHRSPGHVPAGPKTTVATAVSPQPSCAMCPRPYLSLSFARTQQRGNFPFSFFTKTPLCSPTLPCAFATALSSSLQATSLRRSPAATIVCPSVFSQQSLPSCGPEDHAVRLFLPPPSTLL